MIVNVRRARERILFDRAFAALTKNEHVTQANMFPVKVEVGAANRAIFDDKAEILDKTGIRHHALRDGHDCGQWGSGRIFMRGRESPDDGL